MTSDVHKNGRSVNFMTQIWDATIYVRIPETYHQDTRSTLQAMISSNTKNGPINE